MGSKWIEVSLGEISEKIGDGIHGTPTYNNSGNYYFINGSNLIDNSIKITETTKEGANKQVISSQADSLIKISRIWADFFPANTSNQPI